MRLRHWWVMVLMSLCWDRNSFELPSREMITSISLSGTVSDPYQHSPHFPSQKMYEVKNQFLHPSSTHALESNREGKTWKTQVQQSESGYSPSNIVITGYWQSVRMIFILVLGEKALGKDKLTWKSSDFQKSVLVLMQKQIKQDRTTYGKPEIENYS